MADKEGNEFKVDGKQEMMDDLMKAFEGGLDDNITLICSDGVRVSSNKSVLAIRSPFFASMFLGGSNLFSSPKYKHLCCLQFFAESRVHSKQT